MNRIYQSTLTAIILAVFLLSVAVSPAPALPPDPDNAALLYYQGFLSLPQLSQEERSHIGEVARGKVPPDDQVREHIAQSNGAIHFVEAAINVPDCQWGVRFSQGFDALLPQMAQMRFMTFVLIADARIHAADGDYRGALKRCLMTETFACHIGDDTFISYLVSISVRAMAYKCIEDVAGLAADDVELLQWLKSELAKSPVDTISAIRPLKYEIEVFTDLMRMENIEKLAHIMSNSNEDTAAEIVKKVNAKILRKSRQLYTERMNSVIKVWNSSMPYQKAYSQLDELSNKFDSSDSAEVAQALMPAINRVFLLNTRIEAQANAVKAGIEILLDRAKTEKLPDALPEGLPKDAFSGEDFKYEKTEEGFILHCRDKELGKEELYQFEFKLNK